MFHAVTISLFILLSVFSFPIMANNHINGNAFDSACIIFKKALESNLKPLKMSEKISNDLNKLDEQFALMDVKKLYRALSQVDPTKRYAIFKQAAEYKLKTKWDCDGMRLVYAIHASKY